MTSSGLSRRSFLAATSAAAASLVSSRSEANEFSSSAGKLKLEVAAQGLENPWGFVFLPEGGMLVSERPGRLRIADAGKLTPPVAGLPEVAASGQGGLLDVALDPDYARNATIYWSYAEPREVGNGTAIARGRLTDRLGPQPRLEDVTVIFRQMPTYRSRNHFGCRLAFAPDGTLFATLGDRYGGKDMAQTLDNHLGKVIRIDRNGAAPASNPFIGVAGALPEIWSFGHRNPQGAAIDPVSGQLYTVEHGARGGDELNRPEGGKNYGWPVITYGRDYSGAAIGVGTAREGLEQPLHYWDPSIAPSGLCFYTGKAIPGFTGSIFVGALAGMMLVRLTLKDGAVTGEERLLENLGERIRDVRQGPDGALYLATDNTEGRILRLSLA
jgi:aldose sugar dehydrogenase